jgi:hypothetical protein
MVFIGCLGVSHEKRESKIIVETEPSHLRGR